MDKTFEKRKKVIYDLICDDLYTPIFYENGGTLLYGSVSFYYL